MDWREKRAYVVTGAIILAAVVGFVALLLLDPTGMSRNLLLGRP